MVKNLKKFIAFIYQLEFNIPESMVTIYVILFLVYLFKFCQKLLFINNEYISYVIRLKTVQVLTSQTLIVRV